ncbi:amino acid ABC transporter permease [Rubellimicrobium arenae]|uniref:amino acid ABC transporter permease n=1 Tax=Rubellimicrobium arenae TaxID=2817372 RepID=UPI001B3116AF|nr:amino acid ABC transporter permease [Rubellimicrobium arenae]
MSDTHAQTVAQVRDTMLPPAPPPRRETGAIHWLRENLFSGWLNIVLTILAIWLVWTVLSGFVPWAWRGIWGAGSLTECRQIRDQLYPAGTSVACWSVISERWQQLIFGFYPPGGYWRPPVALAVFLVAVLPILFTDLPRRLLWLTVAAPFLIFFLLWGGTIWGPLTMALGVVLGGVVWLTGRRTGSPLVTLVATILVPLLFWMFLAKPLAAELAQLAPWGLPRVASKDFGGFTLSVVIGLSAICLSLPLGVLLALGRRSDMFFISKIAIAYIELIRGVPLIVWLFTAQLLLNYFLPRGTNFDLMLRVIIMATLFAAAYIAEVVRGGLAALPKGQYEAADALGLDYWQAMRLIVLPQALKISIPGIVNTFIGLFKDTTLVAFIGMYDPIGLATAIRASTDWQGIYWEIYVFIALVFFIFCFAMSRYSIWLERRLERSHR